MLSAGTCTGLYSRHSNGYRALEENCRGLGLVFCSWKVSVGVLAKSHRHLAVSPLCTSQNFWDRGCHFDRCWGIHRNSRSKDLNFRRHLIIVY